MLSRVADEGLGASLRVWCSPTSLGAKDRSFWFDSIDEASFFLKVYTIRLQDTAWG